MTEGLLERHFRAMLPETRVIALEDLAGPVGVGCMDGRRSHCVTAAPGGSAGLLILLLASWEAARGRELPAPTIDWVFARYLDHFGTFYLHTDRAAQDRLARALARALDRPLPPVDDLVRNPPPALRQALGDALLVPDQLGCGHLRLLLEEPAAYRVRRGLTEAVLRGFFHRLWDGDARLTLEVLDGDHGERALARIRTHAHGGPENGAVVAPCPAHGALQLFVHHPDAVAWLQARHAEFMATSAVGLVPPDVVPACVARQRALGEHHMHTTLQRLAPGLPVFNVHIELGHDRVPAEVHIRRLMNSRT
jgi:hypothetical protein